MMNFTYTKPSTAQQALNALAKNGSAQLIAGGTNLVDLMKKGVAAPEHLVDITGLPLTGIEKKGTVLRIGALALNSEVAAHKHVRDSHPLLAQAIEAGASAQIRNMATTGGNLMQRTRCPYFYNVDMPCNKRQPGSGCGALKGFNRMHAIFGASEQCIAVHPSDMCVALVALDAMVVVTGPKGERRIPFGQFHRLPGTTPQQDNNLQRGELITAIDIPDNRYAPHSHYLKIRDRNSYAFALVSVAAALQLDGNTIQAARLGMGGVAHKPWRATAAEVYLKGKRATEKVFDEAAAIAVQGAKGYGHNNFKLKLAPATIVEALKKAAGVSS